MSSDPPLRKSNNNVCLQVPNEKCGFEYEDDSVRSRGIWFVLTWLFGIICILLLATIVWMSAVDKTNDIRKDECIPHNDVISDVKSQERGKRSPELSLKFRKTNGSDVFEELTKDELDTIVRYLHSDPSLNLVAPNKPAVNTNYIHTIEMKMPYKDEVIAYLNGSIKKPERAATVFIFRGADDPPSVDEYKVGNINGKIYAHLVHTDRRHTHIPFIYRPFSTAEFFSIFRYILPQVTKQAGHVLKESYDALPMNCDKKCLKISMAPVSSTFIPEGKRKSWFWFQQDIEFASIRSLDFQFLVDTTSTNASNWIIEDVFYANQMFPNLTYFLEEYERGSINKTKIPFPSEEEQTWSTMKFRTPLVPDVPFRAPRQFEPDQRRFKITDNEIHYMDWKIHFRVSTTGGLHLMNIRFAGERIIYELSMQEVVVMYGGNNPYSKTMNYADGAGIYGTRHRGLLPGVDCPGHAEFVNNYLYSYNEGGGRMYENAFCVFEFNTHTPIRRHRAYGRSGALFGGLEGIVLVVRSIISVLNYDYVFDYIFYPVGAVEAKVSMTGYLGTTFYFPEDHLYGTRIHEHVSAPLHNHLFHFKVDMDIKGRQNRYETLNIKVRQEEDQWVQGRTVHQAYVVRELKETELSATYKYNFSSPKVHVFSNNNDISPLGNPRGYRIQIQKMAKQLLPEGYGFENAISWSRYQMAVTRYKPEEDRSSSLFTMWDAREPVVNFQKYLDDDDSLVDEDLVTWITLGTPHFPQTENLPTTTVVGTQLSFHILPFNYFDEDPSMRSRDAVRITPLNATRPLEGANVEQYGALENVQCVPWHKYPMELLKKNSTFLFS